jgi:signal peptidase I
MNKLGKEILIFVLIIFSIYFCLNYLTTKVFFLCRVQQTSMENTLLPNQILLGKRQHFVKNDIKRGDIVVFLSPSPPSNVLLIKRVVGLPGEQVTIKNGQVYVNNASTPLEEKYRIPDTPTRKFNFENVKVPSASVFLMGDNSPSSIDSRTFGSVKLDNILGKIFFRLYPIKKIGQL